MSLARKKNHYAHAYADGDKKLFPVDLLAIRKKEPFEEILHSRWKKRFEVHKSCLWWNRLPHDILCDTNWRKKMYRKWEISKSQKSIGETEYAR